MPHPIRRRPVPAAPDLAAHPHPVLQRILAARQVRSSAELDYDARHLLPPATLGGTAAAAELLETALREAWRIVVVADFDADGATACALCVRALRAMGAGEVFYLVPNRFVHGYGLSPAIAELAAEHFQPRLLLTVDNGIASIEGVRRARQLGMRVLVTDHHLPGEELPEAEVIVNPNQPGDDFPSKHLAGVGVAFYVMAALRARLQESGWFEQRGLPRPNLGRLLDLVALGTVADVVALDYNNRILVAQGLERIRRGQCCAGIQALLEVGGRDQARLSAGDLGFYLGPRLNAAGRMEDMGYGIECLLNDAPVSAVEQARQLDEFNQERRAVEQQMLLEAETILRAMRLQPAQELPFGLCLYDPTWHSGVIGILASRVKEQVHRPVIIFTANPSGDPDAAEPETPAPLLRGSARSVAGVHIRDVLADIDARHPGLIERFGGHAMAAGLSLAPERFEDFCREFDREVRRHLPPDAMQGLIDSDGALEPADFNLEFAESLRDLGPWGQAFPEPVFDGEFELLERRLLKDRHLKLRVRPLGGGEPLDAIAFNTQDHDWPPQVSRVTLAYHLDINAYRGERTVQLNVRYLGLE